MEIFSFLRLTGRRVVGLTMVAGLAATGAGYVVTQAPATYQASATVFVGQALPAGVSAFDLAPLIADFQAALDLPTVVEATASAAEVAPGDFAITTRRNGDGSTVRVTATAPSAAAAERVASTISLEAMQFVTTRQVDRARSLEAQREDEADIARGALSELDATNGFVDPVAQYAAVQAQATQLQLEAENPGSGLTDAQRAGQLEQARTLRDSLPQLALKAQQYQTARASVTDAEASATSATRDRVAAEAVQASATSPDTVAEEQASAVSPLTDLLRAAGGAGIVAAGAGIGVLALADERRRRRVGAASPGGEAGRRGAHREAGEDDEGTAGTPGAAGEAHADGAADGEPADQVDVGAGDDAEVYDYEAHDEADDEADAAGPEGEVGDEPISLTGAAQGRG